MDVVRITGATLLVLLILTRYSEVQRSETRAARTTMDLRRDVETIAEYVH